MDIGPQKYYGGLFYNMVDGGSGNYWYPPCPTESKYGDDSERFRNDPPRRWMNIRDLGRGRGLS